MATRRGLVGVFSQRCGVSLSAICGLVFLSVAVCRAADDALLREQLASGEFAPALETAQRQPAPIRDRWLEAIAAAQGQVGARDASFSTAGEIGDDRTRSRTLKELAREPLGGRGGGVQPDFDSLIELITGTINPTTWSDVGGTGAVKAFPGGVYVDADGAMRKARVAEVGLELKDVRAAAAGASQQRQARHPSALRKISLPRLEKEVQLRLAAGRPLDEEMLVLAGLERIQYVLVYPETGDLVLAGPAGDWTTDAQSRIVSVAGGRPVVRLEDLVVLLRHGLHAHPASFGCSITPTQQGLARTQAFADRSSQTPLKPGRRGAWLAELRDQMGAQTIEVQGLDPRTRAAEVLVEADYHMKLIGIGLEPGTLGVPSYLEMVKVGRGEAPPPLSVLRWWFTMNYKAVLAAADRDAFELRGQGVKVLSENEMLTEAGQRVHTGQSDLWNQEFAHNFTQHFADLSVRYPIYAELQNVFDLALVASLMKAEGLPDRVGWHVTCFDDPAAFPVALGTPPKTVETVVNHRVVNSVHVLAAVSGGVSAEPDALVKPTAIEVDRQGALTSEIRRAEPAKVAPHSWWWD
jgi:uncharacterized protein DUF1598